MVDLSNKCLLMIEPKSNKREAVVEDDYTRKMRRLMKLAQNSGPRYKGFHQCACGECSDSSDYFIGRFMTNSLAVHYLRDHRSEVPESELKKIDSIKA